MRSEIIREGIGEALASVRILERNAIQAEGSREWCCVREAIEGTARLDGSVVKADSSANAGFSILREAVRKPYARTHVAPVVVGTRRWTAGVAAILEAVRNIAVPLRLRCGVRFETDSSAPSFTVRHIRIPPDAQIERQPLLHL